MTHYNLIVLKISRGAYQAWFAWSHSPAIRINIKGIFWFLYHALPTSVHRHDSSRKIIKRWMDEKKEVLFQGRWLSREKRRSSSGKSYNSRYRLLCQAYFFSSWHFFNPSQQYSLVRFFFFSPLFSFLYPCLGLFFYTSILTPNLSLSALLYEVHELFHCCYLFLCFFVSFFFPINFLPSVEFFC